ncbi:MAG: pitrilysin family protein, partial [Candidatus Gastranaerophilales bacterium]|nr:pitrilysin family protein [Candidatus Gastranaerophilales bacterium]
MSKFQRYALENGADVIIQQRKNTPRVAFEIFIKANNELSKIPALANIMARLFLQGTKTKTQQEIAQFIDENGIDFSIDAKNDFFRIHTYCLNEDFKKVLAFIDDIIKNSTFDAVEKECFKLEGEITAELDSPRAKAVDNLAKNIFANHPYGNTYTVILENLKNITKEKVVNYYENIIVPQNINIVVVGDVDDSDVLADLNKYFGTIADKDSSLIEFDTPKIDSDKIVAIAKEDAQQAQVLQGWITCSTKDPDFAPLSVLNTILGSAGLSSRLFLELRDKKGLAYVVRSSFDGMKSAGLFSVYIATAPKNIQVCLDGFKEE